MTSEVTKFLRLGAIPLLLSPLSVSAQGAPPGYPYPNAELETVIVDATADTSVLQLAPTRNYGSSRTLDANRALINVSEQAFRSAVGSSDYIASAKLRLTLKPSLLPKLPATLTAHRVLKDWTEQGATWNCAIDSNTSNLRNDCSGATDWSMTSGDAFVSTPLDGTTLPLFRYGVVELDITADVRAHNSDGTFRGWLLKTDGIDLSALDDFYSRESSSPPQLVMEVRHCNATICSDGAQCTADVCGDAGFCVNNNAPDASCDDDDPCTLQDTCDADGGCVGQRVEPGTSCGPNDLICDALGRCIYYASEPGSCARHEAGTQCDDQDPCTQFEFCDANGNCVGTPRPEGTSCGEGDLICSALGECVHPAEALSSQPE